MFGVEFLTLSAIKKTKAIEREPQRAKLFPFVPEDSKLKEKFWTINTPKNANKIPNIVIIGNLLLKINISTIRVKRGAVVPNKVALEIVVSFTAEKNNAKWKPKNTPAITTGNIFDGCNLPCLFIEL